MTRCHNQTNNSELSLATESIEARCSRCNRDFVARVLVLDWGFKQSRLTSRVCAECAEILEAKEVERRNCDLKAIEDSRQIKREDDWRALCPQEFRLKSEGQGATDIARLELEQPKLKNVLAWQFGCRGLIIRGPTRRCKTRAMWRLIRRLWLEGRSVEALTSTAFDRECRDAGGTFTLSLWFARLARTDVLFIDDLGKAKWTDATESQWFDLVDDRTRNHRPILITTNEDGQSLASQLSQKRAESVVQRLREFCDCIVF